MNVADSAINFWSPHEGGLAQFVFFVGLGSMAIYFALQVLLIYYEAGKGKEQERELEREGQAAFPSPMRRYSHAFCLRIAVSAAFGIEGLLFGSVWPTNILILVACFCWYGLSPKRKWIRRGSDLDSE